MESIHQGECIEGGISKEGEWGEGRTNTGGGLYNKAGNQYNRESTQGRANTRENKYKVE